MTRGDNIFPTGEPPRACAICGQYETGRGFRMGFARTAHGRKHVREGLAREVIGHRYEYVMTDAGVVVAVALLRSERCGRCGLAAPQHTRDCITGYLERESRRTTRRIA